MGMSNMLLAIPDLSDGASAITALNEVVGGEVANLLRVQPTDVWRSTVTTETIKINLGALEDVNMVALMFTNLTGTATWRVRVATTEANLTASPLHDSSVVSAHASPNNSVRPHCFDFFTAVNAQWIQIDIIDGSNPDGYVEAGRVYVSNAYQPTINYRYGNSTGFKDYSTKQRTVGGQTVVTKRAIVPMASIVMLANDEAELFNNVHDINELKGASEDMLLVLDPESANVHKKMYYGLMRDGARLVNPRYSVYEQSYTIEGLA